MRKPIFKRQIAPITGAPDPNSEIESRAVSAFRALEAVLNRIFNNHTALNKVRGMMDALGVEVTEMPPRAKERNSDAQTEGHQLAMSYVLASEIMIEDWGERYIARIGALMAPVARQRIKMQAETASWERHCRQKLITGGQQ